MTETNFKLNNELVVIVTRSIIVILQLKRRIFKGLKHGLHVFINT